MSNSTPTQLIFAVATSIFVGAFLFRRRSDLDHIPTVGYSHPILSVISCTEYLFRAREILHEGYRRYPGRAFKIPTFDGWLVILNGSHHVEDIRQGTEEQMSALASMAEYFQYQHTLGPRFVENPYHVDVVRKDMTRNVDARFQGIYSEVVRVYEEAIPTAKEWVPLTAYSLQVEVICRVSSRYFVGQSLCENSEFLEICKRATAEIFKGRFIRFFPTPLRPFASWLITDIHGLRSKMVKFLQPLIEHRLEQEGIHGHKWLDRPNDLITWLMNAARTTGEGISAADLSARVLFLNFGATITSAAALTSTLYRLCLDPGDLNDLKEEVEHVIKEEGWTKSALDKMYKLDSYLREIQRMHSPGMITMGRTMLKDYLFSDGTFVPKGTKIAVNLDARHYDANIYPDPDIFNGFRHVRTDRASQPMAVTPTLQYHAFGHGRSACPGRFFAVSELKTILAHIVTSYDIRLEREVYPPMLMTEVNVIPNTSAKVLFRRRAG